MTTAAQKLSGKSRRSYDGDSSPFGGSKSRAGKRRKVLRKRAITTYGSAPTASSTSSGLSSTRMSRNNSTGSESSAGGTSMLNQSAPRRSLATSTSSIVRSEGEMRERLLAAAQRVRDDRDTSGGASVAQRKAQQLAALMALAMDKEVPARAFALVRAWVNVVEAVHGPVAALLGASASNRRRSSGASEPAIGEEETNFQVGKTPSRVRSLVEIAAGTVGWGIEEAVESCIRQETESGVESGGENERPVLKGLLEEDREDEMALVDEWYEACPEYCWRTMFAQHATAILVEKLYDSPYVIVESLFHVARLAGATSEARRFYDVLNSVALRETPREPRLAITLASYAYGLGQLQAYNDSLIDQLLSSSFSERLFYSRFVTTTDWDLWTEADGSPAAHVAVEHLSAMCHVACEMLSSLSAAAQNDEPGVPRLVEEVVTRIAWLGGESINGCRASPLSKQLETFQSMSDSLDSVRLSAAPCMPAKFVTVSIMVELAALYLASSGLVDTTPSVGQIRRILDLERHANDVLSTWDDLDPITLPSTRPCRLDFGLLCENLVTSSMHVTVFDDRARILTIILAELRSRHLPAIEELLLFGFAVESRTVQQHGGRLPCPNLNRSAKDPDQTESPEQWCMCQLRFVWRDLKEARQRQQHRVRDQDGNTVTSVPATPRVPRQGADRDGDSSSSSTDPRTLLLKSPIGLTPLSAAARSQLAGGRVGLRRAGGKLQSPRRRPAPTRHRGVVGRASKSRTQDVLSDSSQSAIEDEGESSSLALSCDESDNEGDQVAQTLLSRRRKTEPDARSAGQLELEILSEPIVPYCATSDVDDIDMLAQPIVLRHAKPGLDSTTGLAKRLHVDVDADRRHLIRHGNVGKRPRLVRFDVASTSSSSVGFVDDSSGDQSDDELAM